MAARWPGNELRNNQGSPPPCDMHRPVPMMAASDPGRVVGGLAPVAFFALQHPAPHGRAPRRRHHPGAVDKGRLMTHMLVVAAGQPGHPVALFILMKPDHGLFHDLKPVEHGLVIVVGIQGHAVLRGQIVELGLLDGQFIHHDGVVVQLPQLA